MIVKLIGALLIVFGCGGFGFGVAAAHRREEQTLRQLIGVMDYISCELQYRLTPLPQLCRQAALECSGVLQKIFTAFADELDMQVSADAEACMKAALGKCNDVPKHTYEAVKKLGHTLGRFDMEGQLQDLENVRQDCRRILADLSQNRDARLRTYQTLGLCAGAALAILFV